MQLFVAGYYQTVPRRLADEGAQTTKVTVSNERESSAECSWWRTVYESCTTRAFA